LTRDKICTIFSFIVFPVGLFIFIYNEDDRILNFLN
jgi:hypothetical protein